MERKIIVLVGLLCVLLNVSVASLSFAGEPLTPEDETLIKNFMTNVIRWTNVTSITPQELPWDYAAQGKINDALVQARVCFEDGVVWGYELLSSPNPNNISNKTVEECLSMVKNSVKAYGELFNYSLCNLFASMVPESVAENTTIESEGMGLKITITEENLKLDWGHYKLGNYTLCDVATIIWFKISKKSLITDFGRATGYLATSEVNITKEQAIAMALPYAEAYAQNHGRTIQSIEAIMVLNNRRNESEALYPMWLIKFIFDERDDTLIYGYNAAIWADTGDLHYSGELCKPSGISVGKPLPPFMLTLTAILIGAVIFLSGVGIYKYRRKHKAIAKSFSLIPDKIQHALKTAFHR